MIRYRMNRLTYQKPEGIWGVKGIEWDEIPKDLCSRLYGALCKLRDYENTGLDVEKLETIDRLYQQSTQDINFYHGERFNEYRCPNKKCSMSVSEEYTYCSYCGQKIKFKETPVVKKIEISMKVDGVKINEQGNFI